MCPRGSSALDKQTQSPFLQGQGTRGTVKTSFSNLAPPDAPFPRARRPMASVARRGLPGGRATEMRDPRRGQPCAPPAQGEGSPMHSARWDVNPRPECQPQRRHSEEPRVTEGRDHGGDKGVVAGEHNESKGVQRSCSAPKSRDPAPRSSCDMGTGGRGRGCCTWTSALEYTCQPGNR